MNGLKRICGSRHKTRLTQLEFCADAMGVLSSHMTQKIRIVFAQVALDVLARWSKVTILGLGGLLKEEHVVAAVVCGVCSNDFGSCG